MMRNCSKASARCGMIDCTHEDCKRIVLSRPCTCPSVGQYYFSHDSQVAAVAQAKECKRHSYSGEN